MKKPDEFARFKIPAGNIRSFSQITVAARERKVVHCAQAAVFSGNDVIGLKRQPVKR